MNSIQNIEALAQILGDGGPHNPDIRFETVEQVVDALVDLGRCDKVFVRHDEHLGLKSNLSQQFLSASLDELDNPAFEEGIQAVLEQANIIVPLSRRTLTEADQERIDEDKASRGEPLED